VKRGKSSWIESKKVDTVEEHVQDAEDRCDADGDESLIHVLRTS